MNQKKLKYSTVNAGFIYNLGFRRIGFNHLDMEFEDLSIKLPLVHYYQRGDVNRGYGKGFKLNLEQELIKTEETTYKLICPGGEEELFEELYYIKQDNKRVYISKSDVTILPDKTLKYNDKVVYKEIKNNKGIILSGDYTDFINCDKLDFRNDELIELDNSIIELKHNIENLNYNIYEYSKYGNEYFLKLQEAQKIYESKNKELSEYKNSSEYIEKMDAYYNLKKEYYETTKKVVRNVGGFTESLTFVSDLSRMTYVNEFGYNSDKYNQLSKYGGDISSLSEDEKKYIYNTQQFENILDTKNQSIQDALNAVDLNLWMHQKDCIDAEYNYLVEKEDYENESLEKQKEYYNAVLSLVSKLKENYEKILFTKEYEKEKLLKLIPKLYLSNSDGLVYGFNELGKLSVIFDAYEHQITINYNDKDQIKNVIDEKGSIINFIYNESNNLIKVYGSNGDYINYEYDEEYLVKIIYSDNERIMLEYIDGYLCKYIDINNEGYYLEYKNEELSEIREIFITSDNSLINNIDYFNYSDNFVKISNNKNRLVCNYSFDLEGNLITEYIEKNEELYELTTYEEEEKCCSNTIKVNRNAKKIAISNSINLTNSKQSESIIVSNLINSYSTDYILYAFAEADSSLDINKIRKTAYCNHIYNSDSNVHFCMCATLVYGGDRITYTIPFNPYIKTKQLVALPISLKEDLNGSAIIPNEIIVSFDYSNNINTCTITDVTLALGEYVYSKYNEAYNKTIDYYSEVVSPKTIMGEIQGEYRNKKKVEYLYNDNELLEKEIETAYYEEYDQSNILVSKDTKEYTKSYKYNSNNKIIKEEDSRGNILEYLYNDNGLCIMKRSYSKALPNEVYIEECEYDDKGNVITKANSLGYKEEYKYINSNNNIITTPRGNILNITSSDNSNSISAYDDGVENYNNSVYENGRLVEYNSSGMKYSYDYDEYGREKNFYINNQLYCSFEYTETYSTISYKTIYKNNCGYEKVTDKYGNTIKINKIINNNTYDYIEYILDSNDRIIKEIEHIEGKEYLIEYNYIDEILSSINTGEYIKSMNYNIYGAESETIYQIDGNVIRYNKEYNDDLLSEYSLYYNNNIIYKEELKLDKLNRVINNINTLAIDNYTYLSKNGRTTNLISLNQKNINGNIQRYKYKYDKEGNIISKEENYEYSRYTYDSLNRLIREDNKSFNKTYIYSYDSNGNILNKGIYNYTLDDNLENEEIIRYNYNSFNDYLTSYNGQAIEYDNIGNPIIYKNKSLIWDQKDLIRYDKCEFTYNNHHIRKTKRIGNKKIEYILDGNVILKEKITNYNTYLYLDEKITEGQTVDKNVEEIEYIYSTKGIIGFKYKEEIYYYNKNIFQDILEIYDSNYNLVAKYEYDAWGNHKIIVNIKVL